MSPQNPDEVWSLEQLQNIACAALWFETFFDDILPNSRLDNTHSKSNQNNIALKGLPLKECIEWIRKCEKVSELVWLMNPGLLGTATPSKKTFPANPNVSRFFGWNFSNLKEHPKAKNTIGMSEHLDPYR